MTAQQLDLEEVPLTRSVGIHEEVTVFSSVLGEALRQAAGKIHHYLE